MAGYVRQQAPLGIPPLSHHRRPDALQGGVQMNALQGIIATLHDKHGTAFIEAMRLYLQRHDKDERAKQ